MQSFFNNLFRKKTSPTQDDDSSSQPSVTDRDISDISQEEPTSSMASTNSHLETRQIIVGVAQSVGIEREKNEDSIFTLTTNLISKDISSNFGLYIVADGMGGHENGELASNLAVGILASYVINSFFLPSLSSQNNPVNIPIQELMHTGVMNAHQAIREKALGSGTTITATLVLGDQMTIAHVGDSRAYSIAPDGSIKLLTHDHSLVKRLEEIGQISPEEASVHPKRNLLYRALGQGETFEPDISSFQVCQGCGLLLCSDGLWGVVPEKQITDTLRSSTEPQLVCQSLIQAANAAGGPDNISVIVVRYPG